MNAINASSPINSTNAINSSNPKNSLAREIFIRRNSKTTSLEYNSDSETYFTGPMTAINATWMRYTLLAIIVILVSLFLYGNALQSLVTAVLHREGSSHGLLVPFLSGFFFWVKRDTIHNIELRYDYLGVPLVIIGTLFPLLHFGPYRLECLSLITFISGMIIVFLGRGFFKHISFPLLFLISMVPLPQNFYASLANITRDITLGGSLWVISRVGIPYFREGYLIHLPHIVLNVAIGCSGIRYLISYFVLGLIYAYLFRERAISRFSVLGATIPISILAGICRLTAIFLLTYIFGPQMANFWPHVLTSWGVFFIILILAIGLDQFLQNKREFAKKLGGLKAR